MAEMNPKVSESIQILEREINKSRGFAVLRDVLIDIRNADGLKHNAFVERDKILLDRSPTAALRWWPIASKAGR